MFLRWQRATNKITEPASVINTTNVTTTAIMTGMYHEFVIYCESSLSAGGIAVSFMTRHVVLSVM